MYDPDTRKSVEISMDQGQYVLDLWVPKAGSKHAHPTRGPTPALPGRSPEDRQCTREGALAELTDRKAYTH